MKNFKTCNTITCKIKIWILMTRLQIFWGWNVYYHKSCILKSRNRDRGNKNIYSAVAACQKHKKKSFLKIKKKKLQNHSKLFEILYILIVYIKAIFSNSFLYSVQSFCFHHFLRNISMIICMKIPLYSNNIHFLEQTQDEPLPYGQLKDDWNVTKRWRNGKAVPFSHLSVTFQLTFSWLKDRGSSCDFFWI